MAGRHSVDTGRTTTTYAVPVHEEFTVAPERLAQAKTAAVRLLTLVILLTVVAVLPWLLFPPAKGLTSIHWVSIGLGSFTMFAGVTAWWQRRTARWWIDAQHTVLKITDDEIVLRGSIRIPTNVIVGVWGYRSRSSQGCVSRNPLRRLLSENGARTSAITILVSNLAPIIDPHHRLRRFTSEEVAGRIEIPFGAYLDDEGALDAAFDAFGKALGAHRPAKILSSFHDYGAVWSGNPSRMVTGRKLER